MWQLNFLHFVADLQFHKLEWWAVLIISVGIASIVAVAMLLWGKNSIQKKVMLQAEEELSRNPDDTVLRDEINQARSSSVYNGLKLFLSVSIQY